MRKYLLTLLCLLACMTLQAQDVPVDTLENDTTPPPPTWLELFMERIDPLVKEADRVPYYSGICIYDLTDDSLIFAYNQQKVMRPASTQKVLTAVTALAVLGKNHRYTTRLFHDGRITTDTTIFQIPISPEPTDSLISPDSLMIQNYRDSLVINYTLHGNIYIVGSFDPMLTHANLKDMANAIEKLGINRIDGQLVADVSMKDTVRWGSGWCWDDVPSDYMPALTPIMFNNQERLNSRNSHNLPNADRYFMETLRQELRSRGFSFAHTDNVIRFASTPIGAQQGKEFYSCYHTIEQVLQRMMKKSSNLYAESMFYQLATLNKKSGATWKDGTRQVEQLVARAGGNIGQIEVVDGSGLSLYDYVTPETEVAILRFAYKNKIIYNSLYAAMPIAGVDGTLQKRMLSGPAHRNVHAKTGTVEGVSCLAGYVRASNGHTLAFSIMNNGILKSSIARDFQDRWCQAMAE